MQAAQSCGENEVAGDEFCCTNFLHAHCKLLHYYVTFFLFNMMTN